VRNSLKNEIGIHSDPNPSLYPNPNPNRDPNPNSNPLFQPLFPNPNQVYRHRIGRTARGGRGGTAISLVCADDKPEEDLLAEVWGDIGEV